MHEPHDEPESDASVGRLRSDRGAAAVEFAFIVPLLALFIFGIITFGLILSFKQDVTRAAAEGSRAGAVAFPGSRALAEAQGATQEAVSSFGQSCGVDGMTCNVAVIPCQQPSFAGQECVEVELVYDYGNYPLIAKLPLLSGFLPNTIQHTSVARIND